MRRKYTIARPPGNRAASASQFLWFFCNTLPAGPFSLHSQDHERRHGGVLPPDGAPWVGFKVPAHSRGIPRHEHRNRLPPAPDGRGRGIGLGPAAARRSATSACAPTRPGTGARPRAREFLPQLWLAVTLSPPPLGRGGLQDGRQRAAVGASSGFVATRRSVLYWPFPTAASPFRPPWPVAA